MKHNYKNYLISTNQDGDYLAHLNGLLMFGPVYNLNTLHNIIDSFIIYGIK